jgi:hypothetical protein
LKRKKKAVITKIKDVYGIAPSEESPTTTTPTEGPTIAPNDPDGGPFEYQTPGEYDGGEF